MKLRYKAAMQLAEKIATLSEHKVHKIGCVITDKRHNLVSVGANGYKTHPVQARFGGKHNLSIHAEVAALVKSEGKGYNMYVVRVKLSGGTGIAKPCKSCQAAIVHYGIENVYWSE